MIECSCCSDGLFSWRIDITIISVEIVTTAPLPSEKIASFAIFLLSRSRPRTGNRQYYCSFNPYMSPDYDLCFTTVMSCTPPVVELWECSCHGYHLGMFYHLISCLLLENSHTFSFVSTIDGTWEILLGENYFWQFAVLPSKFRFFNRTIKLVPSLVVLETVETGLTDLCTHKY